MTSTTSPTKARRPPSPSHGPCPRRSLSKAGHGPATPTRPRRRRGGPQRVVSVMSNRTGDLADALKRRCLYHWIDYPDPEREIEIVRRRVPDAKHELAVDVAAAVRSLRAIDVQKPPGIAEAIDWV